MVQSKSSLLRYVFVKLLITILNYMSSIKIGWIGNKWWNNFTAFVHEMPFTSWETVVKMYKQFFQHIYTWKLNKDTYWVEDVFSFDFHCNQLTLKNMVGRNCCCCGARRASISCHLNVSFLFLDSVVFFVLRLFKSVYEWLNCPSCCA